MEPGPKSKTLFMESMWKDLPAVHLERVFTFLPTASLCRFRTLSKDWNSFISSPSFKHAGAASDDDHALITPSYAERLANLGDERSIASGWVMLDVPRMRYFTLSNAFLIEYVHRLVDAEEWPFLPSLAASDGGLLCMWYYINNETSPIFVCNPVLKTVKQLPHPGRALWSMDGTHLVTDTARTIVMATDCRSMEYVILIVNTVGRYVDTTNPFALESILVYESKTGTWRAAPSCRPVSHQIWWGSLAVFDKNLYCIVDRAGDSSLVSYDKETAVVADLPGIHFPSAPGSRLVVSKAKARLFCVIPGGVPAVSLDIYEVDVMKGASTWVTEMPRELIIWVLGHDLGCSLYNAESKIKAVIACGDWILIATVVGRCAAYSLSCKSWHQFPDDSTIWTAFRFREGYEGSDYDEVDELSVHGSSNCLSLCAP